MSQKDQRVHSKNVSSTQNILKQSRPTENPIDLNVVGAYTLSPHAGEGFCHLEQKCVFILFGHRYLSKYFKC